MLSGKIPGQALSKLKLLELKGTKSNVKALEAIALFVSCLCTAENSKLSILENLNQLLESEEAQVLASTIEIPPVRPRYWLHCTCCYGDFYLSSAKMQAEKRLDSSLLLQITENILKRLKNLDIKIQTLKTDLPAALEIVYLKSGSNDQNPDYFFACADENIHLWQRARGSTNFKITLPLYCLARPSACLSLTDSQLVISTRNIFSEGKEYEAAVVERKLIIKKELTGETMSQEILLKSLIKIGSLELKLDDLAALRPGSCINFSLPESTQVCLEIAGQTVAKGELRQSQDSYAITISETTGNFLATSFE